jgi:hypothetical protein
LKHGFVLTVFPRNPLGEFQNLVWGLPVAPNFPLGLPPYCLWISLDFLGIPFALSLTPFALFRDSLWIPALLRFLCTLCGSQFARFVGPLNSFWMPFELRLGSLDVLELPRAPSGFLLDFVQAPTDSLETLWHAPKTPTGKS